MKPIRDILIIALIGAALAGAYWMGRRSVAVETVETVRIDTVFYEKPAPVTVSRRSIAIDVPRVLFAPAASTGSAGSTGSTESTGSAPVAPQKDSVRMELEFQTVEYADSTYRAQVSGPAIGEYGPRLDWCETYDRTTLRQQMQKDRKRFALTVGIGAAYTPKGINPTIGIQLGIVLWRF